MEDFAQITGKALSIRLGRHDVLHMVPPLAADFGVADGFPARFAFDLGIAEKHARLGIEVDRIIMDAVLLQHGQNLRPDRAMPLFVFGVKTRIDEHDQGFADHPARIEVAGRFTSTAEALRRLARGQDLRLFLLWLFDFLLPTVVAFTHNKLLVDCRQSEAARPKRNRKRQKKPFRTEDCKGD